MRIFLSLLIVLSFSFAQAQGLEFNRVVVLKGEAPTGLSTIGTVPAGKVWKVEAVALESNVVWVTNTSGDFIFLNSNSDNVYLLADNTDEKLANPVWLPAGETIELNRTSSSTGYFFSIIEFNAN